MEDGAGADPLPPPDMRSGDGPASGASPARLMAPLDRGGSGLV